MPALPRLILSPGMVGLTAGQVGATLIHLVIQKHIFLYLSHATRAGPDTTNNRFESARRITRAGMSLPPYDCCSGSKREHGWLKTS